MTNRRQNASQRIYQVCPTQVQMKMRDGRKRIDPMMTPAQPIQNLRVFLNKKMARTSSKTQMAEERKEGNMSPPNHHDGIHGFFSPASWSCTVRFDLSIDRSQLSLTQSILRLAR